MRAGIMLRTIWNTVIAVVVVTLTQLPAPSREVETRVLAMDDFSEISLTRYPL